MAIKFFGHYLLDNNTLSSDQLIEAVEYQNSKNLSLGALAVREGMITDKQAETINDKQRSLDKRFGEVSIQLGLLTDEQIGTLLGFQKKEKVFFGEVLVLKKFMTENELAAELKLFEELQKIETVELDDKLKALDTDNIIKDSIGVLQTLYSRVIHDHIKLVQINDNSFQNDGIIAMQKMRGDIHLDFALQPENDVSLAISQKFMKMDFNEIDEMVLDIINEFVNVVLGNIAVKFSKDGVKVELSPPQTIDKETFNTNDYLSFNFATTQGNITLYLKI